MPQSNEEILRQRLFGLLRPFHPQWLTPALTAAIMFLFPLRALPNWDAVKQVLPLFWPAVPVLILYQLIIWGWLSKLRKTLQTATPTQARKCRTQNIFLGIVSFIFLSACSIVLGTPLGFFGGLIIATFLILPLAKINRLIKLIFLQQESSREKYEESSPCPRMFRKIAFLQSLWALPLFLAAVPLLLFGIIFIVTWPENRIFPWDTVLYISYAMGLLGIGVAILRGAHFWFIKQTAIPSRFQRLIRRVSLPSCPTGKTATKNDADECERVAYKWWLSHPGVPWPENMRELCQYIDTSKFDWQDSMAWESPLKQAAEKFRQTLIPKDIPVLSIGSKAQDMVQKLSTKPVTRVTPLFAAILAQDRTALQKLLPNPGELNRPFAGTGNTLLHVAALNGYTEIVRLLLEQPGIDTARTNNNGQTALDLAREKGFEEIIQLLENKRL